MSNLIVALVIVLIIGLAVTKIIVEKRKGTKCIGCPHGKASGGKCGCH